eukprot:4071732-Prymnesium_polylepis.2
MRTASGAHGRSSTACCIASIVASRMFTSSIILWSTIPTPTDVRRTISSNAASRASSVSFLLSVTPGRSTPAGTTQAAATTGPTRGPRPASSTPATHLKPFRALESS